MHIVKFRESEAGWGGEVWFKGFDTFEQAQAAVDRCNKDLPDDHVPDFYICAYYEGEKDSVPEGYKF